MNGIIMNIPKKYNVQQMLNVKIMTLINMIKKIWKFL